MRLPRMKTRWWMITVAVAALRRNSLPRRLRPRRLRYRLTDEFLRALAVNYS